MALPQRFPARGALALIASLLGGGHLVAQSAAAYTNDFQQAELGKPPADFMILDGGFAVKSEGDNRVLELPGAPLETFGVLFGPAVQDNCQVSARILGTAKGRRTPSFGIGLAGAAGYKLRVSPGKKELELLKGDADLQSVPFAWKSGTWTWFKLQVRKAGDGAWKVEGKAWPEGSPEPAEWTVSVEERETPKTGRASAWGAPYAETPIWFDDFRVTPAP